MPTNEALVFKVKAWPLEGQIPHHAGMKNLHFNEQFRYIDKDPTFADGLCNEIQKLILSVENFVFSTTFSYINLKEQSIFLNFLASDFTMQFKREIQGDTGGKGTYPPDYILNSEVCGFGAWVPVFFEVVEVINNYIGKELESISSTK